MDCYILHTVLRVVILLFTIAFICCRYAKQKSKQKNIGMNIKMENNALKKVCIKICTCYYFDEMPKFEDFDFGNILLDEKSYKNILIYEVLYQTLTGAKPLHIIFDKADEFVRDHDETKYLVLFSPEKYAIYHRIKYLLGLTHGITSTKIDSHDDLLLEETLTLHNVIILIKSGFNKDENHYYYNTLLEKCFYQLVTK